MISTWRVLLLLITAPFLMGLVTTVPSARSPGSDLIGKGAPGWRPLRWGNTLPIRRASLKGKVVLIRWFTDTCPYCAATAPALRKLHADYGRKGLVVIGVYHPKPQRDISRQMVKEIAEEFRFDFPVAADPQWEVLRDWWLDGGNRDYTSVSFLLDKTGTIRLIHAGPQFSLEPTPSMGEEAVKDYEAIRAKIEELLAS